MLHLKALELSLNLAKPLQFGYGLWIRNDGIADDEAIANLFAPARKHERMDAKRLSDVLDKDAGLVAHGNSLELEVIRVPVDEFGSGFGHRGHSPLGLNVHKS